MSSKIFEKSREIEETETQITTLTTNLSVLNAQMKETTLIVAEILRELETNQIDMDVHLNNVKLSALVLASIESQLNELTNSEKAKQVENINNIKARIDNIVIEITSIDNNKVASEKNVHEAENSVKQFEVDEKMAKEQVHTAMNERMCIGSEFEAAKREEWPLIVEHDDAKKEVLFAEKRLEASLSNVISSLANSELSTALIAFATGASLTIPMLITLGTLLIPIVSALLSLQIAKNRCNLAFMRRRNAEIKRKNIETVFNSKKEQEITKRGFLIEIQRKLTRSKDHLENSKKNLKVMINLINQLEFILQLLIVYN